MIVKRGKSGDEALAWRCTLCKQAVSNMPSKKEVNNRKTTTTMFYQEEILEDIDYV